MFTVKWVVKTSRGEITRMFSAYDIKAIYEESRPPANEKPAAVTLPWIVDGREVRGSLVILDGDDLSHGRSLDCGIVYVMNEKGATVGKYQLSDVIVSEKGIPKETQSG